jgi:hypothetical protein
MIRPQGETLGVFPRPSLVGMGPFLRTSVVAPPLLRGEGVTYSEFKVFVLNLAEGDDLTTHGLLPIPTLRRECAGQLSRADVDAFLIQMHDEGAIHLLSHVEFDTLPAAVRREALHLPSGQDLYWIRSL